MKLRSLKKMAVGWAQENASLEMWEDFSIGDLVRTTSNETIATSKS